jgi:hypothetical protein
MDTNTNISSSLNSPATKVSASAIKIDTDKSVKKPIKGRFVKGISGNPSGGGRPKGSVSLKTSLNRLLSKSSSDEIINTLIDMAKSGSIQHTKLVAELTGDITNAPTSQVNIGQATLISTELIDAAREFLISKSNPPSQIIDVSTNVSASITP